MDFTFSIWWFLAGVAIFAIGLVITRFYKQVADNLVFGVASYNKVKLVGVITSVAGLVIMFNLHTLILDLLANVFFGAVINN